MAIKRYTPKYKTLSKLQQPVLIEKRQKLLRLKKQKWDIAKKLYFPKKPKVFSQDSSSCRIGKFFGHDRIVRKKKTYKFLLLAKQRFQKHYGEGRLKFYQLKSLSRLADTCGKNSNQPSSRILQTLLENRLETFFYRLGFTSSLMQVRKLLATHKIQINQSPVFTLGFSLKKNDFVELDTVKYAEIVNLFLKRSMPIFYYRKKKKRRFYLHTRKNSSEISWVLNKKIKFLNFVKNQATNF